MALPTRTDLATKYRPADLESVLGQDHLIGGLADVISHRTTQSIIFTGPSGTGKTTLARIVATMAGCSPRNLVEIDAATHTGVDSMRQVMDGAIYGGMGRSSTKVHIIDEAHRLSLQAWESLLKSVEEPPDHLWWIFCTTNPEKIPKTIQTRCAIFETKPVSDDDIFGLLESVVEAEDYDTGEDVLSLLAARSEGSPRRALTWLATTHGCDDRQAAAQMLSTHADDTQVVDLCRALLKGVNWTRATKLVAKIDGLQAEGARHQIFHYFTKVALDAKGPDQAAKALAVLDAFATPYPNQAGIGHLLLSLGDLLLTD